MMESSLALSGHPRTAGNASALLGVLQYVIGAVAAPLVGIGGTATALPMGVVIAVLGSTALATYLLFTRGAAGPSTACSNDRPRGLEART